MLNGLDLFSGIGGIAVGLGKYVKTIAYCEQNEYGQAVLLSRMADGSLERGPIWDDVRSFPAIHVRKKIDIISAGFPCQDISLAGIQKGLEGERSILFFEVLRIASELQAPIIFLENVPNIRTTCGERVCKELAEAGYDSRWCCISAGDLGAPHKRERWFCLAYNDGKGDKRLSSRKKETVSVPGSRRQYRKRNDWWEAEPCVGRVVDGVPFVVDRLKCLGNAVVPRVVEAAFETLLQI